MGDVQKNPYDESISIWFVTWTSFAVVAVLLVSIYVVITALGGNDAKDACHDAGGVWVSRDSGCAVRLNTP